jgi:hypothetical protein
MYRAALPICTNFSSVINWMRFLKSSTVNWVSAIFEILSIPMLKPIGMAVHFVRQRIEECAAFLARLYVFVLPQLKMEQSVLPCKRFSKRPCLNERFLEHLPACRAIVD